MKDQNLNIKNKRVIILKDLENDNAYIDLKQSFDKYFYKIKEMKKQNLK